MHHIQILNHNLIQYFSCLEGKNKRLILNKRRNKIE